ncbi:hypothetical protein YC2023_120117 [Brassica napus]
MYVETFGRVFLSQNLKIQDWMCIGSSGGIPMGFSSHLLILSSLQWNILSLDNSLTNFQEGGKERRSFHYPVKTQMI